MLETLSYDPTDKYVGVVQFSRNQDTAVAVLQEMLNLFETGEAEETA